MKDTKVTEEFLDTYEGEVMFLSQDLEEIVEQIAGDAFCEETLVVLEQKLEDVSDVFLSSSYTQHVSPMFKSFATYCALLKYDDFKNYTEARNYLKAIVADINTYITFYFIDRNFTDVYLFQDSLANSIDFLKRTYSCAIGHCDEDDGSELDFF